MLSNIVPKTNTSLWEKDKYRKFYLLSNVILVENWFHLRLLKGKQVHPLALEALY